MLTVVLVLIIISYLISRKRQQKSNHPKEILKDIPYLPAALGITTILIIVYGAMINYVANYTSNVVRENSYYADIICRKERIGKLQKEFQETLRDTDMYIESKIEWQAKLDQLIDEIYEEKDMIEEEKEKVKKLPETSIVRLQIYEFLLYFKLPIN